MEGATFALTPAERGQAVELLKKLGRGAEVGAGVGAGAEGGDNPLEIACPKPETGATEARRRK
jgi:hypothetical protein